MNINHLFECVSDSIKKKDEEIANLKLNIKNFETDLETYEDRIKKLEEENKRLYEEHVKNTEKSVNDRIKAAYNDGFREAERKYLPEVSADMYTIKEIVTEIFGSNPEIKTFDDMRYTIEQDRSKAYNKGFKTGKEVIFGNIYKYIVKEFQ